MQTPPRKRKQKSSFTPPPLLRKNEIDPSYHIDLIEKTLKDANMLVENIVQSPLYNKSRNYSFEAKCTHSDERFFVKEGTYKEIRAYEYIQQNRKFNSRIKIPDFRGIITIENNLNKKVLLVFGWIDMSKYRKADNIKQETMLYDELERSLHIKQNDREGTNVMIHMNGEHSLFYDFEDVSVVDVKK
jgi:hypothetical protein